MSTDRFGGFVTIDGVRVSMSDEDVDRLLRTGFRPAGARGDSSGASQTRDDLLELLERDYGFQREVRFRGLNGKRRFKCDAARGRICVDYHGWGSGAAHRSREKQAGDHEKINELSLCGWRYIVCNAISVDNGKCLAWIDTALSRLAEY